MAFKNPLNSIRWKLALTYGGIALLTALALGAALLLPLRRYYQESEMAYLRRNAKTIALAVAPLLEAKEVPPQDLEQHIRMLAVLSQTRVEVMDADRHSLADTQQLASQPVMVVRSEKFQLPLNGDAVSLPAAPLEKQVEEQGLLMPEPPGGGVVVSFAAAGGADVARVDAARVDAARGDVAFQGDRLQFIYGNGPILPGDEVQGGTATKMLVSVVPTTNTLFGFELQPDGVMQLARSNQSYLQPVFSNDQGVIGWVQLSDGPAYGREIVNSVAWAWLAASLVAVLVAGTAGWWVSRRMSAPIVALTDVTRRMAEGNLAVRANLKQNDEFGSLGRSFNEMAERVERTIQALSRFAADAAHELHTPLTALRTNLELAAGETREASGYLERANEQLARMEHLTRDLLDLSRLESGTPENAYETLNLGDLLLQTCEPLASQAEQAGVAFDMDLAQEAVLVSGQRGHLQRMINNLVENALKFTPPGGDVRVGLRIDSSEDHSEGSGSENPQAAQGMARVWVEDSGIGVEPQDLPYLFNRFHRGRNAAGYPGSGLGLSIVRAVAERHGGRVWVEMENGKTRFILLLPRVLSET